MLDPISLNQSRAWGKCIFRCAVSRFEQRVFSCTNFRRSSTRNRSVRVSGVSGFKRRSLSRWRMRMSNRSLASLGSSFAPEGRKLFRQFTKLSDERGR